MDAFIPAVPGSALPAGAPFRVSPLMLADRLLTLAQDADRAGFAMAASHLVTAMYAVLESRQPAWH